MAWNTLVAQYTPAVMSLARRKGLTPQDGEDVAQRTFKQVFMKLSQKNPTDSLGAWINRIAWNILMEFFRTRKMAVPIPDDLPSQNGDMQHSAEIKETFARLGRRLVGNEAKVWKAMTDLLTLDDWTIARATGLPVSVCHTTRGRVEEKVKEERDRQELKPKVKEH
jgi:DNA-directed RNA polymerase specialized sigma24 family protein